MTEIFNLSGDYIIVCGLQVACKGNEADGTMSFELDGKPIDLPCCNQCAQWVDEQSAGVVE